MAQKQISIRIQSHEWFLHTSTKIDDAIEKVWYPAIVTVKKDVGTISEKQRWYYFGCVIDIWREFRWYSKDEMHQLYKRMYLPDYEWLWDQMWNVFDEKKTLDDMRVVMTKFLSIHEDLTITNETPWGFEEYLKRIREWELKMYWLHIPLPNEDQRWQGWQKMM